MVNRSAGRKRTAVVVAAVGLCSFAALASAPADHLLAVALALLNCLLIGGMVLWLLAINPLKHALVLAFLPGVLLSWSITTLYFALAVPEATYDTMEDEVPFLLGAEKLQVVVLVFVAAYALALAPLVLRKREAVDSYGNRELAAGEWGAILLGLFSITAGWLTSVLGLTGALAFPGLALQNYFFALLFVAGFRWQALARYQRAIVVFGLGVCAVMNTVQGGRGLALLPIVMGLLGYLVSPFTKDRQRAFLLGSFVALYPAYLALGNEMRHVFGSKSFDDLGDRLSTLSGTIGGDREVTYDRGGVFSDLMSRHFCAGGHALVVQGWGQHSLTDLPVDEYLYEAGRSILPAFIFGQPGPRRFTGCDVLKDYGFRITSETAVEVSLLGSLYNHGGMGMVFIGGLLIGLAHLAFCRVLFRREVAGWRLMFLSGSVAVSLWAYNNDLIHNVRSQLLMTLYCSLAYVLLRVGRFIATHHWRNTRPVAAMNFVSRRAGGSSG